MSSFHHFSRLPTEIQEQIFSLSKPTTTTIHLLEDEFEITAVSPAPSPLTTTRSSRTVAKSWGLSSFPLWTQDDWQDIFLHPEDSILQLVVSPSRMAALAITWTELHAVLGDALPAVQKLHIVCSESERLARLWMLPEGELVGVGESCVERGSFGKEVLASDREMREQLHAHLTVTVSRCSVEDLEQGVNGEVRVWKVGGEERELLGVEVEGGERMGVQQLHAAAETSPLVYGGWEEAEEEGVGSRVMGEVQGQGSLLTEDALRVLEEEMGKLFPAEEKGPREDPGGSVEPEFD